MEKVRIGLIGVGLDTYWRQFNGLLDKLIKYQTSIENRISTFDSVEVINVGMIDNIEKAHEAASILKKENIELLFLYISTYSLSSSLIPFVKKLSVPIIMLNLSPNSSIDSNKINSLGDRGAKLVNGWLTAKLAHSNFHLFLIYQRQV